MSSQKCELFLKCKKSVPVTFDIHGLGSRVWNLEIYRYLFFFLDELGQMELRCGLAMGQMLPNPQTPTKEPGHETFQLPASAHILLLPPGTLSPSFFLIHWTCDQRFHTKSRVKSLSLAPLEFLSFSQGRA